MTPRGSSADTPAHPTPAKQVYETNGADGKILVNLRAAVSAVISNPTASFWIGVALSVVVFIGGALASALLQDHRSYALLLVALSVGALIVQGILAHHRHWLAGQVAAQQKQEHDDDVSRLQKDHDDDVARLQQDFDGRIALRVTEYAESIALLRSYINPCLETLPRVVLSGDKGTQALASVKQAMVDAAQRICGPSGTRATLFVANKHAMTTEVWSGGARKSTRRFRNHANDPAGREAWESAATGVPKLWPDLAGEAPRYFQRDPSSTYGTFVTCGILGDDGTVFGMLNVDAPRAGDLTAVDGILVSVCSHILGATFELSHSTARVD